MESQAALSMLTALAHDGRLAIFRLLVRRAPDAVPAGEIALALGVRGSTLSNQLNELERSGAVRSERRGRSIRYRVALDAVGGLIGFLANDCCRGRPEACLPVAYRFLERSPDWRRRAEPAPDAPINVLFLCTANSARSVMAEVLLTELGGDRFQAFSAGSQPAGVVHPRARSLLAAQGHDASASTSRSWDDFAGDDAPRIDFVITVCDNAANETCPVWPGAPISAHWGTPDPVAAAESDDEADRAFGAAYETLRARIAAFVALPLDELDSLSLQRKLDAIGLTPNECAPSTANHA